LSLASGRCARGTVQVATIDLLVDR